VCLRVSTGGGNAVLSRNGFRFRRWVGGFGVYLLGWDRAGADVPLCSEVQNMAISD
jgi:hypothetical protein